MHTPAKVFGALVVPLDIDAVVPANSGDEALLCAASLGRLVAKRVTIAPLAGHEVRRTVARHRLRDALVADNSTLADLGEGEMMELVKVLEGRWLAAAPASALAERIRISSLHTDTNPVILPLVERSN
ncbi:hypothetical protein DXU03_15660 [Rhizobium johnstonii]